MITYRIPSYQSSLICTRPEYLSRPPGREEFKQSRHAARPRALSDDGEHALLRDALWLRDSLGNPAALSW